MIQPASCSTEFNRQDNAGGDSGSQAKEKTKAEAVADAEDNGVRYGTGKQAQRTVLSTQQAVSEIETTEHVKTGAGNADDRNGMVVRPTIVDLWMMGDAETTLAAARRDSLKSGKSAGGGFTRR
jgi:hypothetical protein